MRAHSASGWFGIILVSAFLCGCAPLPSARFDEIDYPLPDECPVRRTTAPKKPSSQRQGKSRLAVTERVVTEQEIRKIGDRDPDMSRVACLEILARLNGKARNYIVDDIKARHRIKAPTDFFAYRNWTPMPRNLGGRAHIPKLIVIVKDIPFTGWYENGILKGDSQTCIGKMWGWTHKGFYTVLQKDVDHISQSYTNAYDQPALMPFALWIYARVWIHAGDVTGGFCSHGCINLTIPAAASLFDWADIGTPVLITDSLKDLDKDLKAHPALNQKPKANKPKAIPSGAEKKKTTPAAQGRSGM